MPDHIDHPLRGHDTDDVATRPDATPSRRKSRPKLALILPAAILVAALYTWSTLHFAFYTGTKTGYVNRFSREGRICKTWEGELAMVSIPGAPPDLFAFTVLDDSLAEIITKTKGQNVTITYGEHRGVPTSCFGETPFHVTGVKSTLDE